MTPRRSSTGSEPSLLGWQALAWGILCAVLVGCSQVPSPVAKLLNDTYPSEMTGGSDAIYKLVHHVTEAECIAEFGIGSCRGGDYGTIEDYVYMKNGKAEACYNTYKFKEGDELYVVSDTKLITKEEFVSHCHNNQ